MAQYSNTSFANEASLEPEALALAARLSELERIQAPPAVLTISALLAELAAAATSADAGRIMESKDDRRSLRDDLARSVEALGPCLGNAASTAVYQLRSDLARLPDLLASQQAAPRLAGLAQSVREQFEAQSSVEAAWKDVTDAFLTDETADECEFRVLQLAELVERRGGNWKSTHQRLRSILTDGLDAVSSMTQGPLPDADPDIERAGLSLRERVDLCRDLLGGQPESGDLTVWLGFENARLHQSHLTLGPVEFFSWQAWPDAIREGWPDDDQELKVEFEAEGFDLFLGDPPESPFVLVRVKLGDHYIGSGVERARRLARDLVRAASPGSEWRMLEGGAAYVKGRGWWGTALQVPQSWPTDRFSPEFEPTADGLDKISADTASRIKAGDAWLHSALADIDWSERVGRLEDRHQRVALGTRLLERLLPTAEGEHWSAAARHYLADAWAWWSIQSFVADVAHNAVNTVEFPGPVIGWKQPWRARLLPNQGRHYRIELEETIRALPELLELMPAAKLQSRTVSELGRRMETPGDALAWRSELMVEFERLLDRTVRQRNLILHGADSTPAVVGSVEVFVGGLQARMARDALAAAGADERLALLLERRRAKVRARWRLLENGSDVISALFGDPS